MSFHQQVRLLPAAEQQHDKPTNSLLLALSLLKFLFFTLFDRSESQQLR